MKFSLITILLVYFGIPIVVSAQITTDGTTSTTINSSDRGTIINNGNRQGNNLFHSFEDFSVPPGEEAFFNNADDISNIFSRVTGGNISRINGLIRANGRANLFVINPAGIIFGDGARLQLGGSFYASTADSIVFPSGEFSATNSESPPLLTINIPLGLKFRRSSKPIVNHAGSSTSQSPDFELYDKFLRLNKENANTSRFDKLVGLEVSPGKTLALIGGAIEFSGGNIIAPGANIELGGLATSGIISLENDGRVSFPSEVEKSNVLLKSESIISVRGNDGGSVTINANNLKMFNSAFLVGIKPNYGFPNARAGDINLQLENSVLLDRSLVLNQALTNSQGNSGNINLTSQFLTLNNAAKIKSAIDGIGTGGEINIDVAEKITIDSNAPRYQTSSDIVTRLGTEKNPNAKGKSGNINISTRSLLVNTGSILSKVFGRGNGGDINLNAENIVLQNDTLVTSQIIENSLGNGGNINITTDYLSIRKNLPESARQENLLNATTQGKGNAGNININASQIELSNGTNRIQTIAKQGSTTQGNAGNITINTNTLSMRDNSLISSNTRAKGNAGNIAIYASESIFLTGIEENKKSEIVSQVRTSEEQEEAAIGNGGSIAIRTNTLSLDDFSLISANTTLKSLGNTGNIAINVADSLNISNSSEINLDSQGLGNGGNLSITAKFLNLDRGTISASNFSEQGSKINLTIANNISLQNNSLISARAFENANGGNITINTDFIIARKLQNNDMIAIADRGNGGKLNINAKSLFGIQERLLDDSTNDINATSSFGLSGQITIKKLDNNFDNILELTSEIIDASTLITQNICTQTEKSKFVNIGKGGLPQNPNNVLTGGVINIGLVEPVSKIEAASKISVADLENLEQENLPVTPKLSRKQPAQGWIWNENGSLELVANSPNQSNRRQHGKDSKNCQSN